MIKKIFVILAIVALSGCAQSMTGVNTGTAGFFSGLWHGFICVYSLVGHLFSEKIVIYQTPNNGGWYDFGFIWGAGAFARCCSSGTKKIRRR